MQKIYYKFLHQEKGPRMFMKKRIFKQPILNRQICNTKIEISKKKKNQTKKDLKKWLNLCNYNIVEMKKNIQFFLSKIKITKTKASNWNFKN